MIQASRKLNIHVTTILWRVKSVNKKFDNYQYTDESSNQKSLSTKISIDDIEYNSVLEACKKLKFGSEYITKRINSDLEEDSQWKILDKPREKRSQIGKKVSIDNVIYNSIKDASLKLNIHEVTLAKILNSKVPIPINTKKPVSINNVTYDSVTEASESLKKNINMIVTYLKSEDIKHKDYFYLPIEYIDLTRYKYVI